MKVLQDRILNNPKLSLLLIVLFGLFLRLIFFAGIGTSDDLAYSKYAATIDQGVDKESTLTLSTRLGLIYPTFIFYRLFGINEFSSILFVLVTAIANIILVFYFGKLLFNEKTGLMAAFLLSFFPLEVVYSTRLLSDLPSAFLMALGVYVFLYAEIKSKDKAPYFLSGIFIGMGYMIRESAILIALFFIAYTIYNKKIKKGYFLVLLGFAVVFAFEMLIFYKLTGEPFFRISAPQQYLSEAIIFYDYFGRLSLPLGLLHYPYLFLTNNLISYFYAFVFIAMVYCFVYKKNGTYYMLLWLMPLILYLSFGSSGFSKYIPFKAEVRYLEIVTLPAILVLAFFLSEKNETIKKAIMPSTLVLLLLTSLGAVYLNKDRNVLANLKAAYPYIEKLDKVGYTDSRTVKALNYLSGYKNTPNVKDYPNNMVSIKDVYIIVNNDVIKRLEETHKISLPEEIKNPPKKWTIVKEIGKDENKISIYYVP